MKFWFFMLVINLIFPLTMICWGKYFIKKAPKEINYIFGYRTTMSMKNKDTWNFAHHYFGKLWFKLGVITLPICIIVMLFVIDKSKNIIGTVSTILCIIQLFPIIIPIIPTEIALKKTFDKDGNRL